MSTVANPIFDSLVREGLTDTQGKLTRPGLKYFQGLEARTTQALTILGKIAAPTKIDGRTEGIGTTASQLDAAGKLISTDAIAADGLGSPLAGGKRGFQALDSFNQLASSFHGTGVNLTNVPLSSTTLSNDGVTTVIHIAAASDQFAPGVVTDNGGTVDPGAFGTFFVFHDDPRFTGGAVIYQASTSEPDQAAAEGRILDGKITTALASVTTGGGVTGGTTSGGRGGRNYS